jgi:glutaredoxin
MIVGRRHAGLCVAALLLSLGVVACRRGHAAPSAEPAEPNLVVRSESDGLLLTWIDDKGDFHVETRVADVPMMGRDTVRVVDPNRDESAHPDSVFVVDLRQSRADGSYPVRSMTRTDFEAMAVARREKTGPTLASAAPEAPPNPASSADPSATEAPRRDSRTVVVIYGAEWCGACHEAARYLRRKGIPYVDKDVEKDPEAAREMQQKLAKSGLHEGSIPVIDVRGKVMIGFNPAEIDAALGEPL